jgi:D-alanyl-D-alanine carboxypeptidase/D-alanyl-D-alanine-endopeptidase (penicillin-binding protein 4)
MRRAIARGAALLVAAGCAATTPGGAPAPAGAPPMRLAEFRRLVDSLVLGPAFRNAQWGVLIVDPSTGDTLYSHNAGKLFMPASNQKLLTGATALTQLGADYRFTTAFAASGPVTDGVLDGDLIVDPTGDPTFADVLWNGDHRNAFRAMADSLAAHGVRHVAGALVRGATPFPDEPCGYGWEYGDLDDSFAACVQDLMVNEGARRVPRARFAGDTATTEVAIRDMRGAWWTALRNAMVERGITVAGGVDTGRVAAPAPRTPLFTMRSPALPTIITQMMKPSQNQVAEILFKTLGRERTGVGTADSGRRVVERQLVAWGADTAGFAVRDGSGVSRHDYVTPESIVRILDAMRRGPQWEVWRASLPIAGVDGTIRNRMRGTPAEGNVRAKTGTLDKTRSLSGYLTTADGRLLMFSFLCNAFSTPNVAVERVQDAILVTLASRGRPTR